MRASTSGECYRVVNFRYGLFPQYAIKWKSWRFVPSPISLSRFHHHLEVAMDGRAFDDIARVIGVSSSRRAFSRSLGALVAGGLFAMGSGGAGAKKKKKSAKNNKKNKKKDCPGGCSGGTVCCDGVCVNVITDRNNCGTCGNTCAVEQICDNTTCKSCESPRALCTVAGQQQCVDLKTDSANCGSCGNFCRQESNPLRNQICENGMCRCPVVTCDNGQCCPTGYTVCVDGGIACCPDNHTPCNGRCCEPGFKCGGACTSTCCPA